MDSRNGRSKIAAIQREKPRPGIAEGESRLRMNPDLVNAFTVLAGRATPEQAGALAQRLTQAVEKETDPDRLAGLGFAFAAVAGRATPEQVGTVTERLAQTLQGDTQLFLNADLANTFVAVVGHVAPEQAGALAQR